MINKIKILKTETESENDSIKLFLIIKLQKHLVFVKNGKSWELLLLNVMKLVF